MAVDLSAASLVRAGSGILFFLLGLVVLFRYSRKGTQARLVGSFAVSFGIGFILTNLFGRDLTFGPAASWVVAASYVAFTLTVVSMAFLFPTRATAGDRPLLVVAFAAGLLVAAFNVLFALLQPPTPGPFEDVLRPESGSAAFLIAPLRGVNAAALSVVFLLWPLRVARMPADEAHHARRASLMHAAMVPFPAFLAGAETVGNATAPFFSHVNWPLLFVVITSSFLWIRASGRGPDARASRNVALWSLVLVLTGAIASTLLGTVSATSQGASVGVVRTVAWTVLAYSILRGGLLGFQPGVQVRRRGVMATATLALFFVVAQVVENLLNAQLGLLTGSIIAGAFLFAASPLQRVAERLASDDAAPPAPRLDARRAYRDAVFLALNDGDMTPFEERYLAKLAQDLGLGPLDALQIKDEALNELARTRRTREPA